MNFEVSNDFIENIASWIPYNYSWLSLLRNTSLLNTAFPLVLLYFRHIFYT